MNDGGGGGERRKSLPANESIFMSRVEGRGSRVTTFLIFFFKKMKNKWKTNKKNLKNKWRVDISNQISSNCRVVGAGGGGDRTRYLIT